MTKYEQKLTEKPQKWIYNVVIAIIVLIFIVLSFRGSQINMTRFDSIGITMKIFFRKLVDINPEYLFGFGQYTFNQSIFYLAFETVAIGFLGTFIGAVLAIPVGFLASESIGGKKGSKIGQVLLIVIRVFPEIILAIILLSGFGLNALTGILTIGIHSIGMIGKLYAEAIDNMDRSFIEALDAVGANTMQKIRWGIVPQLMADFSSIALYRFDINVRSATVLGVIGAGGIGTLMISSINFQSWETLGGILVALITVVLIVDAVSSRLRTKLV